MAGSVCEVIRESSEISGRNWCETGGDRRNDRYYGGRHRHSYAGIDDQCSCRKEIGLQKERE